MTQLTTYPSGLSPADLSRREKQAFSAAVNSKITYHRLGTFADVPESSSYKSKVLKLFTSGYYYSVEDNMIVCSHCEFKFNANGFHDVEQHRRKNLRCPGLGNTGFLNFRTRPQIQDIAMNEIFQNDPDLMNNVRGLDLTDSYAATNEEIETVGFDTLTSEQNSSAGNFVEHSNEQIREFNEAYRFNEFQIRVIFILGMFYADGCIKCSSCPYKLNWKVSFFNLIKSHYSMSPHCGTRKKMANTKEHESWSFNVLARTLSICLPTFARSTKKVNQSQAIILAGSGFAFQWRNNMLYCYWCNYVAPENAKTIPIEALFNRHLEQRTCPFVQKFFLKSGPTNTNSFLHTKFLKNYLDNLLVVAVIEEFSATEIQNKSKNGEMLKLLDPPMAYHSFDNLQNPEPSLSLGVSLLEMPNESPLHGNDDSPETNGTARELEQTLRYLSERDRMHPNLRSIPTVNREERTLSSGPAFIGTCVICLASPGDQVFVGCGHVATCKDCSIQVR